MTIFRLGVLGFLIFPLAAEAAPPTAPFVAGFERFARHGEIEKPAAGRLLLTELSCTACHSAKENFLQPKRGPRLTGVGNRLKAPWLKTFLASPQTIKPGTTMPDLFAGWSEDEKTRAIEGLAAFLGSQREAYPEIKGSGANPVPFEFWNKGNPKRGQQLYHQVGCVACHEADPNYETVPTKPSALDQLLEQLDPQELEELGLSAKARRVESVPHGDLPAKYTKKSLTFFLLDPEKMRPAGRMPNLKLAVVEAADIAAYLLRASQEAKPALASESLIREGRQLFVEMGCLHCHEAGGLKAASASKPLAEIAPAASQSCFGKPRRGLPHFALDEAQIEAIRSTLANQAPAEKLIAADRLKFHLLQWNCYACHERDDLGGVGRFRKAYFETVGHVDIGDEGRLPPPLTGVGRKLQSTWLNKVLKGTGDIRPHMQIRMPRFPASAVNPLPALFAQVDHPNGKRPSESEVFGNFREQADAGRVLLDNGCVECHSFRGEALPGVVGIDLEGITNRVHPEWFHDFLLNPGDLKPRTRMPTFFPGGKSQNKAVLKGDPHRQIAAMWAYLKELDKQPLPEKIEAVRARDFELKPKNRPIVLRTFMKEAGTHAIAVGFPESVHFAFDAENSRLAALWRGRFLDAQGTWFSRFTPPAMPLGEGLMKLPEGLPFAVLNGPDQSWPASDPLNPEAQYRGYRLDDAGQPTFLYRYDRFDIEDCIEPAGKTGLKRRWTIKNRKPQENAPVLWFRPNAGKTVKHEAASTYTNDAGLTTKVSKAVGHLGELRQRESGMEWVIPLTIQHEQTVEVQYQW